MDVDEVLPIKPIFFGDFMDPNSDNKMYKYVDDHQKVRYCAINLSSLLDFISDDNYHGRIFGRL